MESLRRRRDRGGGARRGRGVPSGGGGVGVVIVERDGRPPAGGPTGRSSAICRAYYTNAFLAAVARDWIAMFARLRGAHGSTPGSADRPAVPASARGRGDGAPQVEPRLNEPGHPDRPPRTAAGASAHAAGVRPRRDRRSRRSSATRGTPTRTPSPSGCSTGARAGAEGSHRVRRSPPSRPTRARPGRSSRRARGRVRTRPDRGGSVDAHRSPALVGRRAPAARSSGTSSRRSAWGGRTRVRPHGDLPTGYYFRPEGDELFLVGPLHPEPTVDPDRVRRASIRPDEIERLAGRWSGASPALAATRRRGGWASLYDVSPDWQPVIGEIAPGVFVDAGTSGHGFKLAPALGAHIADLILGEDVAPGLADFDPFRFERGRLSRPATARTASWDRRNGWRSQMRAKGRSSRRRRAVQRRSVAARHAHIGRRDERRDRAFLPERADALAPAPAPGNGSTA